MGLKSLETVTFRGTPDRGSSCVLGTHTRGLVPHVSDGLAPARVLRNSWGRASESGTWGLWGQWLGLHRARGRGAGSDLGPKGRMHGLHHPLGGRPRKRRGHEYILGRVEAAETEGRLSISLPRPPGHRGKYPRLGQGRGGGAGLKQWEFTPHVLEAGGPRSRPWQGWSLLGRADGWPSPLVSSCDHPSGCVSIVLTASSDKDASPMGLRPP